MYSRSTFASAWVSAGKVGLNWGGLSMLMTQGRMGKIGVGVGAM